MDANEETKKTRTLTNEENMDEVVSEVRSNKYLSNLDIVGAFDRQSDLEQYIHSERKRWNLEASYKSCFAACRGTLKFVCP